MQQQLLHERLELLENKQDATDALLLPHVGRVNRWIWGGMEKRKELRKRHSVMHGVN